MLSHSTIFRIEEVYFEHFVTLMVLYSRMIKITVVSDGLDYEPPPCSASILSNKARDLQTFLWSLKFWIFNNLEGGTIKPSSLYI